MNPILSKYLFYHPVTLLRGELVWKYLKEYESMQWLSSSQITEYQTKQLRKILLHAYNTVPYYKMIFSENNISINDIQTLDELTLLPITTKTDIVKYSKEMHSNKKFFFSSDKTTGGSTGQAVTITKNSDALARERAATWRAYNWAGVGIGDVQARFWGTPLSIKNKLISKAVDYISNRTRLSAFNINSQSLQNYYNDLARLKPAYLYGYVSLILDFAKFILENNYTHLPSLKSIITTSEVLTQESKVIIESAFKVKVFNEYGCGEVGSIAHECEHGSMHLMAENLILEIDPRNSPDGESGEILVTDLHNYAMPLIRYSIGDFATLSDKTCACGRGLPIIKKIHGRAYDVIKDPDGNKYHPEILMYIFEDLKSQDKGIKQFQVIQKDIDLLEITIIPDPNFKNSTEALLTSRINNDIHPAFKTIFHYTNKINREKSGKLRVIKSEIQI